MKLTLSTNSLKDCPYTEYFKNIDKGTTDQGFQWDGKRLSYIYNGRVYKCDFEKKYQALMRQRKKMSPGPLHKSLKIRPNMLIWEANLGLGGDSLLLLSFGARIKSFEKCLIPYLLVRDGLGFLPTLPWEIVYGDFLQTKVVGERPEGVYLDPMYPLKKRKSAKNMDLMQSVDVGSDEKLLDVAKEIAEKRVVVKRPLKGEYLGEKPEHSYCGHSTRYDMYAVSREN